MSQDFKQPHDAAAEVSVLGCLLLDQQACHEIFQRLDSTDFHLPKHTKLFAAAQSLYARSEPIDEVSLASELARVGATDVGASYIAQVSASAMSSANVTHHVKIVRDKAIARRLLQAATEIAQQATAGTDIHEALDKAEARILEVARRREHKSFSSLRECMLGAFEHIGRSYEHGAAGVSTGFESLDNVTSGLQPSDLIIIAGRPSMGKTAFAMNISVNAAITGKTTAVFSLEMSKEQLVLRMLCSEGRVDASRVRTGGIVGSDWVKVAKSAGMLSECPIHIDDTGSLSILEMRAKARRMRSERGLDLIVVDYLQLMAGKRSDSREREIAEVARGLKSLAKELNVPVVALSQLNRSLESRTDKRPMLSDLRESGAIEQDADVIMFVYRDDYYNPESPDKGTAEIIIGKQRNGPTDTVKLRFCKDYVRFDDCQQK